MIRRGVGVDKILLWSEAGRGCEMDHRRNEEEEGGGGGGIGPVVALENR